MGIAPYTKKELKRCSAVYISIESETYIFPKAIYTSRRYVLIFFSFYEIMVRMVAKRIACYAIML